MSTNRLTSSVAVVGVGDVGAAIAFALILNSVCGQVVVVDPKEEFRNGQVLDLSDATYRGNSSTHIRSGTPEEAGQCDVVVVTAGAKQKSGTLNCFPAAVIQHVGVEYASKLELIITQVKDDLSSSVATSPFSIVLWIR